MPRSLSFAILAIFLAAFSAAAQSPESGSSQPATQPPQDSSTSADAKKPKKVWNNENLSGAQGPVSIVGDPKNKQKTGAPKPADAQYIASARQKLEKLQKQIDDANKELADLKKFSQGDSSANGTGIILYKNYKREPIAVQIRALEDKKKDLQAQIDALLDEARKKGVEPGQLR